MRARYEISGYNIADREVLIRAVALDGRHERVEVSMDKVLEGLFSQPSPRPRVFRPTGCGRS